jgi:hypothetical protein
VEAIIHIHHQEMTAVIIFIVIVTVMLSSFEASHSLTSNEGPFLFGSHELLMESTHPATESIVKHFRTPGAVAYHISFDSQTNISRELYYNNATKEYKYNCLSIQIYSESGFHPTGNPCYTGDYSSGIYQNITVYGSNISIRYYDYSFTLGSYASWGIKVYIQPLNASKVQSKFQIESPHNQAPLQYTVVVAVPGATSYHVEFDSRSSMKTSNGERLTLYKNLLKTTIWGEGYYSGQSTGVVYKSVNITASSFVLDYRSYGSDSWGFRIYCRVSTKRECVSDSKPSPRLLYNNATNSHDCSCSPGSARSGDYRSLNHRYSFNDGTGHDSVGNASITSESGIFPNGSLQGDSLSIIGNFNGTLSVANIVFRGIIFWISTAEAPENQTILTATYYSVECLKSMLVVTYNNGQSYLNTSRVMLPCSGLNNTQIAITTYDSLYEVYVNGRFQFYFPVNVSSGQQSQLFIGPTSPNTYAAFIIDEIRLYSQPSYVLSYNPEYRAGPEIFPCFSCKTSYYDYYYYYSNSSDADTCTQCPRGHYTEEDSGATECTACPLHSELSYNRAFHCECEVGYFYEGKICSPCYYGSTTNGKGATSEDECVNFVSSFAFAFVLLFVTLPLSWIYLVKGGIHFVAEQRKEYSLDFIVPVTFGIVSKVLQLEKAKNNRPETIFFRASSGRSLGRIIYTWLVFVVMLLVLAISAFLCVVIIIIRISFSSLILFRTLRISGFSLVESALVDSIAAWVASYLYIFPSVGFILRPLVEVIRVLSNLHFNLAYHFGVECEGSTAPVKLFLNLFILFVASVFIEADYQILFTLTFPITELSYLSWSLQYVPRSLFTSLFSIVTWTVAQFQPLVTILQYLLTLFTILDFTPNSGIHSYDLSTCGSMDYYAAMTSSYLAYFLSLLAIAVISRIIYPGLPRNINSSSICLLGLSRGMQRYYDHYPRLCSTAQKPWWFQHKGGTELPQSQHLLKQTTWSCTNCLTCLWLPFKWILNLDTVVLRLLENLFHCELQYVASKEERSPDANNDRPESVPVSPYTFRSMVSDADSVGSSDISCEEGMKTEIEIEVSGDVEIEVSGEVEEIAIENDNTGQEESELHSHDSLSTDSEIRVVPSMPLRSSTTKVVFDNESIIAMPNAGDHPEVVYELPTFYQLGQLIYLEYGYFPILVILAIAVISFLFQRWWLEKIINDVTDDFDPYYFDYYWDLRYAYFPSLTFIAVGLLGLTFSSSYRFYWYCVSWKYFNFVYVCLGFWNNHSFQHLSVSQRLKQFLPPEKVSQFSLDGAAAIIIPRAILFQIIPFLSIIPIFAQYIGNSPFTGFDGCHAYDPLYFAVNPWPVLREDRSDEENQSRGQYALQRKQQRWTMYLMTFHDLITGWRVIKLSYNLFLFTIVMALVFLPTAYWNSNESSFVFIVTLTIFIRGMIDTIPLLVKIGQMTDLRDQDFCCSVSSPAPSYAAAGDDTDYDVSEKTQDKNEVTLCL